MIDKQKKLETSVTQVTQQTPSYDIEDMKDGVLSPYAWVQESGMDLNFNGELQYYTSRPENARVQNGILTLEARHESLYNAQYTSARINTKNRFSFTYGTLEIDMKLPKGNGSWPAAWLMPQNPRYNARDYTTDMTNRNTWALNGEIDFMESIGALPGQVIPAAHTYNEIQRQATYTPAYVNDMYTTYHKYGIIKQPGSIVFTIDGKPYASRMRNSDDAREWPFEQPYYLILDLAVGGTWAGQHGIDNSTMPWQLQIKSISYTR